MTATATRAGRIHSHVLTSLPTSENPSPVISCCTSYAM